MTRIVLLDAQALGSDMDLSELGSLGSLTAWADTPDSEIPERVRDAHVILTNKKRLGAHNLGDAKDLKLICVTATGCDSIDAAWCKERGIALCNVPGYSTDSVTQLTLSLVLALSTHLGEYRQYVHSGEYSRGTSPNHLEPRWHELAGKTWGVLGGGAIGHQVGAVARALGCRVLMCRRKADAEFENADIDTLCRESDILTAHVPLTEETRGILSRERIFSMKKGAILVNTARGAVADEEALADALEQGILGGLGVDVYAREPFSQDHPYTRLCNHPNLILTPHMAWGAVEARQRCLHEVAENIRAFFRGEQRNRIV